MSAHSDKEFADRVLDVAQPRTGDFRPVAYYDKDGDCIEFLARPDPFYAERIDKWVTVYYSQHTGEVVGSLIKGVSVLRERILTRCPGFVIAIRDGKVRLAHLFWANLWCQDPDREIPVWAYEKLAQMAMEAGAEAELCEAG